MTRLAQAAESRDTDTGRHIERIGLLCERLGRRIGMHETQSRMLRHASAMHDVGKIAIPDRVLLKAGPLDADEWEIMKTHAAKGAEILSGSTSPLVRMAEQIARSHHERWDGTGYRDGLRGEAIPLTARICASEHEELELDSDAIDLASLPQLEAPDLPGRHLAA